MARWVFIQKQSNTIAQHIYFPQYMQTPSMPVFYDFFSTTYSMSP